MTNRLQPILLQKKREVQALRAQIQSAPQHPLAQLMSGKMVRYAEKNFQASLRCKHLAVIAEIKRKSPSKGVLATINDPVALAQQYLEGGASAISILTDHKFFSGTLQDLTQVANAISANQQPILRKDFIIDPIQIAEAIVAGADAILCIVAILGEKTATLLHAAKSMGIDVLVEVHNEAELEIALQSGAEIIGINNRNLHTMEINIDTALKLLPAIPAAIIKVAESGILEPHLARDYYRAGFDAVLIGEALVTATDPKQFIAACRHE